MANPSAIEKFEKVLVISRSENPKIDRLLKQNRFKLVSNDPDFIVCYGGDGTILYAERKFPQVPKLIIKKSKICRKCDYPLHNLEEVVRKIRDRKFKILKKIKLEARFQKKKLIGLNEIQVHTKSPVHAIRFSVSAARREFNDLIGDGVVIATPFGSTGYFKSTGGKKFKTGIGISFNNLHRKKIRSLVVSEDSTVSIRVHRGPAWILADNNEHFLELEDHGVASIRKSENAANFIYTP